MILVVLAKLCKKSAKATKIIRIVIGYFRYNFFIRLIVETFLLILLSIQIGFTNFGKNSYEMVGQVVSYVFLMCYLYLVPWSFWKIYKN
jgi:hypothetical protein